jgi:nitrile hydratase accessory protein
LSGPEPLPGQPADAEGAPVFAAPWQARAFALTVHLHDRGAFGWDEWAAALARECATQDPGPDGYYAAWVAALGALLADKGLAAPDAVAETAEAWRRAAEATPHGWPIELGAGEG